MSEVLATSIEDLFLLSFKCGLAPKVSNSLTASMCPCSLA